MHFGKRIKLSHDGNFNQSSAAKLLAIEDRLTKNLDLLKFSSPVSCIYKPLKYAHHVHQQFYSKFMINPTQKVMFLGMNPGPWGMVQNGIPFGEHNIVRDWFEITEGIIEQPISQHPDKKILGLQCQRSEVSGKRFWGLLKELCGLPQHFFKHCFVYNICPIAFLSNCGRNITPAELKPAERIALLEVCERSLLEVIEELEVEIIIAVGKFAEKQVGMLLKKVKNVHVKVHCIPHPSPRNPRITNWGETTKLLLQQLNLLQFLSGDT